MRARLRNLGPRSGPPYELFDCAVFLLILGGIGYLLTVPPSTSRDALAFVYHVLFDGRHALWLDLVEGCAGRPAVEDVGDVRGGRRDGHRATGAPVPAGAMRDSG